MNSWLGKYQFNDPWALWLLLFIPISIGVYYWMYSKKMNQLKYLVLIFLMEFLVNGPH